MIAGEKPLSMFVVPTDADFEYFPEEDFDLLVKQGKLTKTVAIEQSAIPGAEAVRRVLYALPDEEWRINAMLHVQSLYESLGPGWRPDLERIIGSLLGYDREDVEEFLRRTPGRMPPPGC
jgi:hypothetical protein